MTTDLLPITLDEMIAELRREVEMRHRVFPRQVQAKLLKAETADRRIAILEALITKLEGERRARNDASRL